MSEKGTIEITIDEDGKVAFSTNLSISELNFWLDHVKYILVSGQASTSDE